MAWDIKFKWPQFQGMDYLELGILLDGNPVGDLNLPGDAVEQPYAAIEEPSRYAGNVRGVTPITPCTIEVVSGGEGSESGGGGGE